MINRLLTGAVALLIAGAAIAIPVMLTEAGSRETSSGVSAQASFEYTDPSTGYHYYGYAAGQRGTTTVSSSGGDGGGGGSQKPHSSGKPSGGQTYTYEDVWAYIDVYDADWNFIGGWDGGVSNGGAGFNVEVADDLSSAFLEADIEADGYGAFDGQTADLIVYLEFVATGSVETIRDRFQSHIRSPRQSYSYSSTTTQRQADATGTLEVDGLNVAEHGSDYAVIGTSASRSRSSY